MVKRIHDTLEALGWEVLSYATYSPGFTPDYHLFALIGHVFANPRFGLYEDVKKSVNEWFTAKGENFYWHGIHKLAGEWGKCTTSDGAYFEQSTFYHSS